MTDATPHRATAEQWEMVQDYSESGCSPESCIFELRARVKVLEVDANEDSASTHFCFDSIIKRLEALEANATCPHVVTGDEGTSYCGLAEQTARIGQSDVPANTSPPAGSLVERVARAISLDAWDATAEARAAIRAVAEWLDSVGNNGSASELRLEANR